MTQPEDVQLQNEALWREVLTKGHKERFAFLPSTTRTAATALECNSGNHHLEVMVRDSLLGSQRLGA